MNLVIPLYVEERKVKGAPAPRYSVRPLFHEEPEFVSEHLSRATSQLAQAMRKRLDALAKEPHQAALAEWAYNPEAREHHAAIELALKRHTQRLRLMLVVVEGLGRKLAFPPLMPSLWFELHRGQDVEERARAVLTEHFLKQEKEDAEDFSFPSFLTNYSRSWLSSVELDVRPHPEVKKADDALSFFLLGAPPVMSGREELHKVGRCLDWMFPDDLDRAILRDAEVGELVTRLAAPDKRPVLLVGPRQAGKTAIIHECVYRRVEKRPSPHVSNRNVWLLAPQRLISGMSYVGQWENRLLAILDEAKKAEHVLYFDDLLGLYAAGQSASSDLTVADVMRPYVERRDFRLLGEITPEALRVLSERDRAFADLFHVLPVREATEAQTRRILVSAMRQFEDRYRCRFDAIEALPTVLDLQQRYVRDLALPGKAAGFLRQLAVKQQQRPLVAMTPHPVAISLPIDRATVIQEFHTKSGLSLSFLDGTAKLEREDVVKALAAQVIGQRRAVDAMADVVCVAKARLNDPGRPLACLLFLGPTGVGKTESAKALARYLFGGDERLLRFDMNEFVDPSSAARLVGTFRDPEGLLTSAVRRTPFSVVLLDEIEKADPAVFDLLLQVLGEGRLTDARGRTADFTNAIVVLTSNLGVREAGAGFGLRPADPSDDDVYVAAAQRFFRPEFFNRLDRVVPFARLTREEVAAIAQKLMADVFKREGLVHRRCVLNVDPLAMQRVVEAGYHPQLGARALKRAVERQLTQPVAARLAAMAPATPAVVSLYPGPAGGIAVHVQDLGEAVPGGAAWARLPEGDPEAVLDAAEAALERLERRAAALEPRGPLAGGAAPAEQFRYLAVRDQARRVGQMIERIDRLLAPPKPAARAVRGSGVLRHPVRAGRRGTMNRMYGHSQQLLRDLLGVEDLHSHLAALAEGDGDVGGEDAGELADRLAELCTEVALLEAMVPAAGGAAPVPQDRALVFIRGVKVQAAPYLLWKEYTTFLQGRYGMSVSLFDEPRFASENWSKAGLWLLAEMPAAAEVFRAEAGTHLFVPRHANVWPVQVMVIPIGEGEAPADAARRHVAAWDAWREALAAGGATPDADPFRLGPIVRIYDDTATVDLRTGLASRGFPEPHELRRFVLSQLPLPEELEQLATAP